ncbi:flagellar export chaperone FliS [Chengkuizengella axinellae]|uniref:Flagellar secretion chaperone FliS n=1 Tax=Chengkuizengella axinellae TaxID=3064388 RepID=A0ABT9J2R1_9BACL|nr:flagellar export chaperone FliS [Chengkuizengella sp. 2205SS18-9]MDP5275890.1 flagellar export chaperone FliS [Chengkuizengella sp. 2205SS18-9]
MYRNQQNKYLQTSIQTASPAKLLIMLYDGAIKFSKLAIVAIEDKNVEAANTNIVKVQNIINEFMVTLDQKADIAEDLMKLYEYMMHRTTEANVKKDVQAMEEVIGFLQELKETWVEASKSLNTNSTEVQYG